MFRFCMLLYSLTVSSFGAGAAAGHLSHDPIAGVVVGGAVLLFGIFIAVLVEGK